MSQQFGSMINMIQSGMRVPTPEIGMGCTILGWTDRHPATVVGIVYKQGRGEHSQDPPTLGYVVIQEDNRPEQPQRRR